MKSSCEMDFGFDILFQWFIFLNYSTCIVNYSKLDCNFHESTMSCNMNFCGGSFCNFL